MKRNPILVGAVAAAVGLASLTGCSGTPAEEQGPTATPAELDAALEKGGTVSWWTWDPGAPAYIAALEKEYPKVKVELNTIEQAQLYTKLANVITANKGIPDLTSVDCQTLPQFTAKGSMLSLSDLGMADLQDQFVKTTWDENTVEGELYSLPTQYAPMALYYNKTVFDANGIEVPTTWDDYIAAAKKLQAADPNVFITSESSSGPFATSMIWQAGGVPFKVDGSKITVNLQDEGSVKWADTWNQLVENKLLSPTPEYTDDWYKQLGNGQIASIVSASWFATLLEFSVPDGAGQWRAAPMPNYDGTPVSAEFGCGGVSVLKGTKDASLAAAVVRYFGTAPAAIDATIASGTLPAYEEALNSPEVLDHAPEYFGGQKINQIAVDSAGTIPGNFQFLPYQNYANQIAVDSLGQAFANHTDLNEALQAWQDSIIEYGNKQGFTVEAG